jgi:hypothetical protein
MRPPIIESDPVASLVQVWQDNTRKTLAMQAGWFSSMDPWLCEPLRPRNPRKTLRLQGNRDPKCGIVVRVEHVLTCSLLFNLISMETCSELEGSRYK